VWLENKDHGVTASGSAGVVLPPRG